MNTRRSYIWLSTIMLGLSALFITFTGWGADVSPPGLTESAPEGSGKLTMLIPLLAPILTALVKTRGPALLEKIPPLWMPLFTALMGLVIGMIDNYALNSGLSPAIGLILGIAGIGVREIADQTKKKIAGSVPTGQSYAVLLLCTVVLVSGCARNPLVLAQQIETGANDTLNLFMKLEYKNRAFIKEKMPEVSAFADTLARKVEIDYRGEKLKVPYGKSLILSLNEARRAAKEAYLAAEAAPTPAAEEKARSKSAALKSALAALEQLIDEAQEHIFAMQKAKLQN